MRSRNVYHSSESPEKGRWRSVALTALFIFGGLVILVRLYNLQVFASDKYRRIAENQHTLQKELMPSRGQIYIRDGDSLLPVAVNKDWMMAYAVPADIENVGEAAILIASALSLNEEEVRSKISNPKDVFKILKRKLGDEETQKLKDLSLKGIHLMPEIFRYYPAQELASHVIGFMGHDGERYAGRYGIEYYWDSRLNGESGHVSQQRDAAGRWISIADRLIVPAQNGVDVVLTLEHTVQYEVEKILKETVEKHRADGGTILVMEPDSGKILAMASYPLFNPNEYSKTEDMAVFVNPSVSHAYESGSVFKPITMAMGLDKKSVSPETTYIDTGAVHEAGYEIKNSDEKAYGRQTMTQVLEASLNTGSIFVQKSLGNKTFAQYVKEFGFGTKTDIELPGESTGNIKNLDYLNRNINFYTASFGQGISVTPLQLITAYGAIANEGTMMKPQIIDHISNPNNGEKDDFEPVEIRRVISREAARQVHKMLENVVENGHGKRAAVPGYRVAGKTGTAQVAKTGERGYEEGMTIGSFVGFAPVEKPLFTVLVRIDNPRDVIWAESSAAPAFGKVMKFLLEYHGIKATEIDQLANSDNSAY